MNRRTFLASLIAIPAGIAAAVKMATAKPVPVAPYYGIGQNLGIHGMLQRCGEVVDNDFICGPQQAKDLEEVFSRLYAIKHRRQYPVSAAENNRRWVEYLNKMHVQKMIAAMHSSELAVCVFC